jgi:hypothetical protein
MKRSSGGFPSHPYIFGAKEAESEKDETKIEKMEMKVIPHEERLMIFKEMINEILFPNFLLFSKLDNENLEKEYLKLIDSIQSSSSLFSIELNFQFFSSSQSVYLVITPLLIQLNSFVWDFVFPKVYVL